MSDERTKRSLIKAASTMGAFTILSRFLGLAREIVRAHYLGTSLMADAFGVAFMIPNLFRRLAGEGAMTAAAVPVFVDEKKAGGLERLNDVAGGFFTLFSFLLTLLCVLFVAASGLLVEHVFARGFADDAQKLALTVELTRWMFFYLLFISLAALLQAILNSFRIFGPSAFTPILLNLAVIGSALFLSEFFSLPVYAFAVGVLAGGALQLFFQWPYVRRAGVRLRPRFNWSDPGVRRILKLMAPGILGAGVYQLNVVISQMIATYLSDGAVSALQYSTRLEEFTLGVFVVAVSTAVLPTFAEQVRDDRMDALRETLEFAMRLVAFVTIPAAVGLIAIRYPLINMLFRTGRFDQTSADMTAFAFLFHASGLFFIGLGRILVPVFYSKKDMITPVKAAVVATAVNIALCLAFFHPLAHGGIALANSLSALAQASVLLFFLVSFIGNLNWKGLFASLFRILLAAGIMGAAAHGMVRFFAMESLLGRTRLVPAVLVVVTISALLYAFTARALRCPEFDELWRMIRRRARTNRPS